MGGGPKAETKNTTEVITNTTTEIRDIGVTGAQAVDFVAVMESGAVARNEVVVDLLQNLVQQTGEGWNRLIGGASELVETQAVAGADVFRAGADVAEIFATEGAWLSKEYVETGAEVSKRLAEEAGLTGKDILTAVTDAAYSISDMVRPLLGVGTDVYEYAGDVSREIVYTAGELGQIAAEQIREPESDIVKLAPWAAIGLTAVIFLWGKN